MITKFLKPKEEPGHPKWEYKMAILNSDSELCAEGALGWELVSASPSHHGHLCYFKREILA